MVWFLYSFFFSWTAQSFINSHSTRWFLVQWMTFRYFYCRVRTWIMEILSIFFNFADPDRWREKAEDRAKTQSQMFELARYAIAKSAWRGESIMKFDWVKWANWGTVVFRQFFLFSLINPGPSVAARMQHKSHPKLHDGVNFIPKSNQYAISIMRKHKRVGTTSITVSLHVSEILTKKKTHWISSMVLNAHKCTNIQIDSGWNGPGMFSLLIDLRDLRVLWCPLD